MIPSIEKASAVEIKKFQEEKLREQLAYLAANSPFYQQHFKTHHVDIAEIQTLEDLVQIPPTVKEDLQEHNDDFLCVPKHEIIDYVTTSGTLGDPVTFALTDKDLERLAYNEALSFACAGVGKQDVLQLMTTIDRRFMAGLAYFLGARKLEAGIIRVGPGIPELQWDSILKFKPTYLIAIPSFLLKLMAYAEQNNIDINNSGIKGVICIGEPLRDHDLSLNTLGKKIKSKWDINLYSTYASTEMSTAFTECEMQQGGHHHPELIIAEILDDNNRPVPKGEAGELTITTLGVEGMPLLRFKTGDIVQAYTEPCSCGRNTMRLGPIIGRKKQMIKYKGTTLYPPVLDNVLNDFSEIQSYVIEIDHNSYGIDEICIKISASDTSERLMKKIRDHFRTKIRVLPLIEFHDFESIQKLKFPKMSRKPITVIDHRRGG
ncbi:AMP-binding protein [Galbibacter sp. EGI 63066]|uniref:phenylacetate--CoA ligase family protein n=1 Tax=Galbibacter sp. EGI 63066 TaxID=2993559 RepID=UPI002249A24A|nr:AMP-binding protein [Galbibacter sp. EGI 63066]MCX2678355.1 AMP-binding protein [Galbibacter sp. EGI 63066]